MNENKTKAESSYDAEDIKVLKGLEAVRKRPGMYIGDTDDGSGLHHMINEVVDNSIDEIAQGEGERINVTIHSDGSVTVEDDGRGIPTGIMKDVGPDGEDMPAATVVMTVLHAGGKFDNESYAASGGLHGVGVSVVNALSEYLHMTIHRDGQVHYQEFADGEPTTPFQQLGDSDRTGTTIRFKPSGNIFSDTEFNFHLVHKRLMEQAYLNPGSHIELLDEREGRQEVMKYEGGIREYVAYLNRQREHPINQEVISINGQMDISAANEVPDIVVVNAALQWCDNSYQEDTRSYTNNIQQRDGGTHLTGFRRALTTTITAYMNELSPIKKNSSINGEDVREGLTAILSVKVKDPKFSSQTKDKLVSSNVEKVVNSVVSKGIREFLDENPKIARPICEKIKHAATVRERARQTRDAARKSQTTALPGKLADCQEQEPEKREIFLVEGESAGGSAKQARDRKYQAILPLKGKILNVHKATDEKIVASEEIQTLITALGTGAKPDFDLSKLRYHRIIIMTDADVDGAHIRTLLLTFFYRSMPELIENGYLYIAQPPLYKAKFKKSERYLNNDDELNAYVLEKAISSARFELKNGVDSDAIVLKDDALMRLCERRIEARRAAEKLSDRIDPSVISVLSGLELLDATRFDDRDYLRSFAEQLAAELSGEVGEYVVEIVENSKDGEPAGYAIKVSKEHMGNSIVSVLDEVIVGSKSYRSITALADEMRQQKVSAVAVQRGSKTAECDDLSGAVDWLMQDTRKGMTIQRYKGLGEMNADQLRETTMDMNERMLRRVRIEDASETVDTFETLMGDKVPPRRVFIEKNALAAKNIDV